MEIYNNLKFELPYLNISNFKQKHYLILTSLIGNSRLGDYMKFEGVGNIYFEDNDIQRKYPKVMKLDQFNRNKTNCLIYSLPYNEKNDEYFDKLFIYYSEVNKHVNYGYLAYNCRTNHCLHRYLIDGDFNDLTRVLNEFFNCLQKNDIYKYYSKKYNSLLNKNGLSIKNCPTIKDYNEMKLNMKLRIEKYRKIS